MFPKKITTWGTGALLGLGLAMGSVGVQAQAGNCEYLVTNEWNSGLSGAIRISNTGSSAINGWSVSWEYDSNRVTNCWNAQLNGSNPYTASDMGWNGTIQPGQSVEFGFQVNKNGGGAEMPEVTGEVCSGGTSSSAPASSSSSVATSSMASSAVSSSAPSSAASSSALSGGEQCNWYGTLYPLCQTTQSGWGCENSESCIARSTCESQPEPYGVVSGGSSASSSVSSSISSSQSSTQSSSQSSVSSSAPGSDLTFESLRNLADFPVGVAVPAGNETNSIFDNDAIGEGQREVITQHFSQITAGNIMKMSYLHNQRGNFTFGNADELVDWALSNNIGVHGHALVWHSDYQVPDWMSNFQGTEEEWVEALREHVIGVASHFAGRVDSWDVVNEAFVDEGYRTDSIFYQNMGERYIEEAFIAANEADPEADLYYNDFSMENGQPKFDNAMAMARDFIERDIPIDGIGFQFHVFIDWPSTSAMREVFSEVVDLGLKVKITELDIPVNNPYGNNYSYPDNYISEYTEEAAQAQKRRYCSIVEAYLAEVPPELRGGITVWGVFDSDSWLIEQTFDNNHDEWPLLFNDNFEPKPPAQGVGDALMGMSCQ